MKQGAETTYRKSILYRFTLEILITILVAIVPFNANAVEKRALLIGISDYPTVKWHPELEWRDIHGANDIVTLTPTLKKHGFKITSLTDSKATAANIRKAFHQLEASASAGDLIYIHFSGHGQAVEDMNGDEVDDCKHVLGAAALTYVAAAASSILQLLRLVLLAGNRRRDD